MGFPFTGGIGIQLHLIPAQTQTAQTVRLAVIMNCTGFSLPSSEGSLLPVARGGSLTAFLDLIAGAMGKEISGRDSVKVVKAFGEPLPAVKRE